MSYLDELRNELAKRHVKQSVIDDILADHEDMIREAMNEGLSEAELNTKFGDPSHLAAELADSSESEEEEKEPVGGSWKTFTLSSSELSVDVRLINEDVTVRVSDGSTLEVFSTASEKALKDYECDVQNGKLTLSAPRLKGFSRFGHNANEHSFEIRIPKKILLVGVKIATVNGDIVGAGLDATQCETNTTNGDLHLSRGSVGKLKVNTVNGDVHLESLEIGSYQGSSVAADVVVRQVKVKGDMILNSVSGDADIRDSVADYAELQTVSGDLTGTEFYPVRLALKSVSGDIRIANKRRDAVEVVRKQSVSGSISIGEPR
jgi:hypothetical protein